MDKLKQAIQDNNLELLRECDVLTTQEMQSSRYINFGGSPRLNVYHGAIGWAIYCEADQSIFEFLLEKQAPRMKILKHDNQWLSAYEAASYCQLDENITQLLK